MRAPRHRLRIGACGAALVCALAAAPAHAGAATPAASPGAVCKAGSVRQRVTLTLQPPGSQAVVSAVLSLTYDPALLQLPAIGSGGTVRKRLTARGDAMLTPNNLGTLVRIVAARSGGLAAGPLVDIEFDRCAGARTPTANDLRCTVDSCAGGGGTVSGCACTASLQ